MKLLLRTLVLGFIGGAAGFVLQDAAKLELPISPVLVGIIVGAILALLISGPADVLDGQKPGSPVKAFFVLLLLAILALVLFFVSEGFTRLPFNR